MSKFGAFPLVMTLIGVLCLIGGIVNYINEEKFFATAEQYTATITQYVPDPNYGTADFCPVYEFTTKDGQDITYTGDSCVSKPDQSTIGQKEQAYIDPQNPYSVESRGWFGSEGSGLIVGLAGCVFFPAISLITVFAQRRRKASKSILMDSELKYLSELQADEKDRKKTGSKS